MNCNEVIAHVGNAQAGETLLHPNDHVNLSQSSNDTFPSALHIAAVTALHTRLEPALTEMLLCLQRLETDNQTVVKTGRTHLQGRGAHHLRPGNQRLAVHAGARPGHDPRLTGRPV